MNWDLEIKRIESEVQTIIDATIEDTRKKFYYCQEEQQLKEVLQVICSTLPHYPNRYSQKDFHMQGTKANIETKFIFCCAQLCSEKKSEYIPEKYAEILCTKALPDFIKNYIHLSDETIDVAFLKQKYKGEKGIILLLENCISCSLHSNFLYSRPCEDFLPHDTPPTNTNPLRKHLGLATIIHGKPITDILKLNIVNSHKIRKSENFFLLFDVLFELDMFLDETGKVPSKKDYFQALDSIFTLPKHERFSNYIYQAKSTKGKDDFVAIFESMLTIAKQKYG